jgi:hypothetical protein
MRYRFRWPRIVRVTSAKVHRWPTLYRNTYPTRRFGDRRDWDCWVGLALYWRQRGVSLLWGRPDGLK